MVTDSPVPGAPIETGRTLGLFVIHPWAPFAIPFPAPYAPCVRVQRVFPPQSSIGGLLQPVCGLHSSLVQGFPSPQPSAKPPHTLPSHASFTVHASSSSQLVPDGFGVVPHPKNLSQTGSAHGLVVVQVRDVPGWQ